MKLPALAGVVKEEAEEDEEVPTERRFTSAFPDDSATAARASTELAISAANITAMPATSEVCAEGKRVVQVNPPLVQIRIHQLDRSWYHPQHAPAMHGYLPR
jgi:hypothetical protein